MTERITIKAENIQIGDHFRLANRVGPKIDSVTDQGNLGIRVTTVNGGARTCARWDDVNVVRGIDYYETPNLVFGGTI